MNRRKFIQSSALAAVSTLVLQNKLQALTLNSGFNKHLLIDLGAVRFQDVITDAEQTAMPRLLQLISSGELILDASDQAMNTNNKLTELLENATLFELRTYDQPSVFYDIALIQSSIDSVIHASQNLFVKIHQTEMAHYNVESYRSLLSQADELISKNFMRLTQSGVQVHIYSSSGRNLKPDEYGGLHHHATDSNCKKTFYMQSATVQKIV
jgi:prophage DNA circulation protein